MDYNDSKDLDLRGTDEPITDWKNEPDVGTLRNDLTMSKPSRDAHVTQVQHWLGLKDAKQPHTQKGHSKTRSSVQPRLIRRQAEWRYSALTEPFLGSDKMFTMSPTTWEDETAAEQNELVINWQFRTKLKKVKFIDEFVRTTVDEGTCAVRVGWIRRTEMVTEQVPVWEYVAMPDPEWMEQLEQIAGLQQQNPRGFNELPEEIKESFNYTMETGQPVMAQQVDVEEIEVEKILENRPSLDIVHYENMYLDPSCEGDLEKAKFAILTFNTSKAEMIADGRYKNLDRINWSSSTPNSEPDHAMSNMNDGMEFKDELRKTVVAYEYWGWYDIHGDDTLVPIVATWIGNIMVRMEENPYPDEKIPIVMVPYMPVKKSVHGEPDAEILEDNQAILGAVTRGMIDLMGRSANAQTGFAKGMLDVVNRKRYNSGADYEFNPNNHPTVSIHEHKYPEIPNSALSMLNLQNQEAEALSGVKAFSGGLSGEAFGDVAAGIRGMLDASSKREMAILRRLAEGMEEIGRKICSMNAVFMSEEEVVRVTNAEYVVVKREDLAGHYDVEVDIATAEVDEAKSQDLAFLLQTMGNNMDFSITQKILSSIAKLKRMPALAQEIGEFQPQPDPLEEAMKQAEIEHLQAQTMALQAKAELDMAKARTEGSTADSKDLDFLETESGTKHARDMDRMSAQGKANQDLAITKSMLDQKDPEKTGPDIEGALTYKMIGDKLTDMMSE